MRSSAAVEPEVVERADSGIDDLNRRPHGVLRTVTNSILKKSKKRELTLECDL